MPLVSMVSLLQRGMREKFAVPLFDLFEMSGGEDCLAAAEQRRAPVIAGVYHTRFDQPSSPALIACLKALAGLSSAPVSVMLDHGTSFDQCARAIDLGFTDVMFDGSPLSLDENIAATRRVVEYAHARNAGVEAELGRVGLGRDYREITAQRKGFTDPEEAVIFVNETGVDILAVAIGTAHGAYHGDPKLDFELLAEIRRRTNVPLALHGGSGLSEKQFRGAIAGGISKINIATDLVDAASSRMKAAAAQEKASMFTIMEQLHAAMREKCGYYLDFFKSTGKA